MGRHKSLKLPFLKLKLKSNTIYSILSLLLLSVFVVTIFSFNQKAKGLNSIQELIRFYFGKGAFFFPIIFLFAAGVLIQTKKLKFIKPNWFAGYLIIFFSYITVLQTGYLGKLISDNVSEFISRPATVAVFSILILIGFLIFFEIALQDFLQAVFKGVDKAAKEFAKVQGQLAKSKPVQKEEAKKEVEFVGDLKAQIPMPLGNSSLAISKDKTVKSLVPAPAPFIQEKGRMLSSNTQWRFPPLSLINKTQELDADRGNIKYNSDVIEKTLDSFGIEAKIAEVNKGPAITQYALRIKMGVNLSRITNLSGNLALALAAPTGQIRIEAPIPGKSFVGIEVPNIRSKIVTLKSMLESSIFADRNKLLQVPLGIDVSGNPLSIEINKMPHLLVAGTTGSGKSVMLSSWISTLLFRTTPDEVGLILIDPKRVTFMLFDGIPHLMTPIITDWKEALKALQWAVKKMEERYDILAAAKNSDIFSFNNQRKNPEEKMKFIVICIDELADLMMNASKEVESAITRVAQKARAVGIYLIIATQRPSVDVITGLMKANIPARVAFNVSSMIDSRVIIDMPGAEKLLGRGDMLFMSPDQAKPKRLQGPFISEEEVNAVVDFLKSNQVPVHYTEEIVEQPLKTSLDTKGNMVVKDTSKDPLFWEAAQFVVETKKGSSSMLQRRFGLGFARAARIIDDLTAMGILGPANGSKPREVLVTDLEQFKQK